LSDPLLLESLGLKSVKALTGEKDLEAPIWTVQGRGSQLLVEIDTSRQPKIGATAATKHWVVDVPLHLRYLPPVFGSNATNSNTPEGSTTDVVMPWPVVFWACRGDTSGTKLAVNPFDRVNLGYDSLFEEPRTQFYHLSPVPDLSAVTGEVPTINRHKHGILVETLRVPVLDANWAGVVEWGTVIAVVAGFLWVSWSLLKAARGKRMVKTGQKLDGKTL
jgi:PIG-X / PBN1